MLLTANQKHHEIWIIWYVSCYCRGDITHFYFTWTNVDFLLVRFPSIHLRATSGRVPELIFCKMCAEHNEYLYPDTRPFHFSSSRSSFQWKARTLTLLFDCLRVTCLRDDLPHWDKMWINLIGKSRDMCDHKIDTSAIHTIKYTHRFHILFYCAYTDSLHWQTGGINGMDKRQSKGYPCIWYRYDSHLRVYGDTKNKAISFLRNGGQSVIRWLRHFPIVNHAQIATQLKPRVLMERAISPWFFLLSRRRRLTLLSYRYQHTNIHLPKS